MASNKDSTIIRPTLWDGNESISWGGDSITEIVKGMVDEDIIVDGTGGATSESSRRTTVRSTDKKRFNDKSDANTHN